MPELDLKFELEEDVYFDLNQHDVEINVIRENAQTGWNRVNFDYHESYQLHAQLLLTNDFPEIGGT